MRGMRTYVVAGLTVIILTSCSGEAASPSVPPSPTPQDPAVSPRATPSLPPSEPSATSSTAPVGGGDLRITWSEQPFEADVAAVAVDGERLIAVGRDADGLAAWVSSDGVSWERHVVPDPGSLDTLGDSLGLSMGPIARLGDTLFSFGTFRGVTDYRRPLGWRSPDGIDWEYIESDNPFFGYGGVVHLTASDSALVAVTEGGLIGPAQTVWRWTSETSWTETALISTADRALAIHDVIWGDGRYVAVGATYQASDAPQDEWPPQPAGWVSTDGRAWDPMALPERMLATCAVARAPGGGFLVLGSTPDGAAAWTSSDGATWTDAALLDADWDEGCWSLHVTAVEGGFLAAVNAPGKLIISTSHDGASWAHAELPDVTTSSHRMAVLGDQVIVFANRLQADDEDGTVLLRGVVHP